MDSEAEDDATVIYVTDEQLKAIVADILTQYPRLADVRHGCCSSPWHSWLDYLSHEEREALVRLQTARFLLGEKGGNR